MRDFTPWSVALGLVVLAEAGACGPRVPDDDSSGGVPNEQDAGDGACEESSCSSAQACGEEQRNCSGALGIGECIDGKCGPKLFACVVASTADHTCAEVCGARELTCVENGCDGATAFGYPGPQHEAVQLCGSSALGDREAVTDIPGPCDQELVFSGEGSFSLYQCCCDDPDW